MFKLDEKLASDTVELELWPLSQVRLMNDSNYPWVVLVPARLDMRELHQLEPADRAQLMEEITRAAWALERMVTPHKMNVAALGNQVAQLHVHVIARFTTDPAWPRPVWGVAPPIPYGGDAIEDFKRRFAAAAQQ
jgi:diadenosine tetraphosphate (Ap4A) HIT family hydrolase